VDLVKNKMNHQLLTQAIELFVERDYEEALRILLQAADEKGATAEVDYYSGLCYANLAETEKAVMLLEQALAGLIIPEQQKKAFAVLGYLYGGSQAYEQSLNYFEMLLDIDPKSIVAHAGIGYAASRSGNYKRARDILMAGLQIDPDNANLHNSLGYVYLEGFNDREAAEQECQAALALDKNNGAIYDSLAWICYRKGEMEKAAEYIKTARSLLPFHQEIETHYQWIMDGQEKETR